MHTCTAAICLQRPFWSVCLLDRIGGWLEYYNIVENVVQGKPENLCLAPVRLDP